MCNNFQHSFWCDTETGTPKCFFSMLRWNGESSRKCSASYFVTLIFAFAYIKTIFTVRRCIGDNLNRTRNSLTGEQKKFEEIKGNKILSMNARAACRPFRRLCATIYIHWTMTRRRWQWQWQPEIDESICVTESFNSHQRIMIHGISSNVRPEMWYNKICWRLKFPFCVLIAFAETLCIEIHCRISLPHRCNY